MQGMIGECCPTAVGVQLGCCGEKLQTCGSIESGVDFVVESAWGPSWGPGNLGGRAGKRPGSAQSPGVRDAAPKLAMTCEQVVCLLPISRGKSPSTWPSPGSTRARLDDDRPGLIDSTEFGPLLPKVGPLSVNLGAFDGIVLCVILSSCVPGAG